MDALAKLILAVGVAMVVLGGAVALGDKIGLGRLPGDLRWKRDDVVVYAPIATCLLTSVVATLLFNVFLRR